MENITLYSIFVSSSEQFTATLGSVVTQPHVTIDTVHPLVAQFEMRHVIQVVLICLIIATNGIVLWTIMRHKLYLDMKYCFVANLAVSDLLAALLGYTYLLLRNLYAQYITETMCLIGYGVVAMVLGASILNLLALTINQYMAIMYPLRYKKLMTNRLVIAMIIAVWTVSGCVSFLPLMGLHYDLVGECNYHIHKGSYLVIHTTVFYLAPLTMVAVLYYGIYTTLRRHQKSIVAQEALSADIVNTRQQKRPSLTIIFLIGTFALCNLPFFSMCIIQIFYPPVFMEYGAYAGFLAALNNLLDPFIYALQSKQLRNRIRKCTNRVTPITFVETNP